MRVTIHDVQRVSAQWFSERGVHWAKVEVVDGGYTGQSNETEIVLFFPTAAAAMAFAGAVNYGGTPARNFVLIDTAASPEPAA